MSYFSKTGFGGTDSTAAEKFSWSPGYQTDTLQSPLSPLSAITTQSGRSKKRINNVSRPWRHSVSHHILSSATPPSSSTVRHFRPRRQRRRLFVAAFLQWLVTLFFCMLLGLCLWGFSRLLLMKVWQVKTFNALMVLGSLWLGNNLTGSLKEYAMMMRWRLLGMKYRPLREADLIMHCESLRKVCKLLFVARPKSGWGISTTQLACIGWLSINLALAVLVALLGLTYNIETASYPELRFGSVSIANLSLIRDVWASPTPTYSGQLGAAQGFGIQGQDYNFTDSPVPGQDGLAVWGSPFTPNIYAVDNWTEMRYYFMDLNPDNPNLSVLTKRYISTSVTCVEYPLVDRGNGQGNGTNSYITYLDPAGKQTTLNAVRVGPGAMTYISALNSTCGPRCAEIFALQSAGVSYVPEPSFYHCQSTISPVMGIDSYVQSNQTADLYQMPDSQAQIMAGAIGWTGFNFTADDKYQYVRYATDSWWSPSGPTNTSQMAGHIMEFAIEAIAALDNNGARETVAGWYPVPSQVVSVQWKWALTLLAVVPGLHLLAMVMVIAWANEAIIRDESCISVAKLWRPVVDKLGPHGCLLTGEEICDHLGNINVKYGVMGVGPDGENRNELTDQEIARGLRFENEIVANRVFHVGMIEQGEAPSYLQLDLQQGVGGGVGAGSGTAADHENGGIRRASHKGKTHVNFPEGLYDGNGNGNGNADADADADEWEDVRMDVDVDVDVDAEADQDEHIVVVGTAAASGVDDRRRDKTALRSLLYRRAQRRRVGR